jgi:hypothetical protein
MVIRQARSLKIRKACRDRQLKPTNKNDFTLDNHSPKRFLQIKKIKFPGRPARPGNYSKSAVKSIRSFVDSDPVD